MTNPTESEAQDELATQIATDVDQYQATHAPDETAPQWCDPIETLRIGVAYAFWAAQRFASRTRTPLSLYGYPSFLGPRYRQRQRNRVKRSRR
jgi:hypothetical protein